MTLLWTESCDEYPYNASGADASGTVGWTSATNVLNNLVLGGDRYTGDSVGASWAAGLSTTVLAKNFPTADAHATLIAGWAMQPSGTTTLNSLTEIFAFRDSGGANIRATVWMKMLNTTTRAYSIEVRSGSSSSGTLLATTTIAVVDNASWYYVEVKLVCNATTGSVTVRVNELQVAAATNVDTTGGVAGTTFGAIRWSVAAPTLWSVDDLYVCNGAGSTNIDFLGDVRVVTLRPNAAGSSSGWTPHGDGTNHYENVNNVNPLAPATIYNSAGTDEASEYYNMANLPASATGTIFGLRQTTSLWCSALNVGAAMLIKDSTTEVEGSELALGTTPAAAPATAEFVVISETKPSGGAWTTAEINAMQLGIRVKSIT